MSLGVERTGSHPVIWSRNCQWPTHL